MKLSFKEVLVNKEISKTENEVNDEKDKKEVFVDFNDDEGLNLKSKFLGEQTDFRTKVWICETFHLNKRELASGHITAHSKIYSARKFIFYNFCYNIEKNYPEFYEFEDIEETDLFRKKVKVGTELKDKKELNRSLIKNWKRFEYLVNVFNNYVKNQEKEFKYNIFSVPLNN